MSHSKPPVWVQLGDGEPRVVADYDPSDKRPGCAMDDWDAAALLLCVMPRDDGGAYDDEQRCEDLIAIAERMIDASLNIERGTE